MDQTDYDELAKTVRFMRERGVKSLRMMGLEIELGPEVEVFEVDEPPRVDKPAETLKPRKGRDGLTAQEQIDTYGRVLDAQE
jgi:hypothetical protein